MATQDINALLDTQPPALPANVARVTADGRPTRHLLDWELFQTDWFRSNIVATDQRIDQVKATADGASAAVTTETQARISADGALALRIDSVEAYVGDATAEGQIYFAAKAGPAGSIAAYGLYLTANNTFTGFEAVAASDGTSYIALKAGSVEIEASEFKLTDAGTAQNVFNYMGEVFTFNVPVQIRTGDILDGAVSTVWQGLDSSSHTAFVDATLRAGSRVAIVATTKGSNGNAVAWTSVTQDMVIEIEGSVVARTGLNFFRDINGSNQQTFLLSTTLQHRYTVPSSGGYRFRVRAEHGLPYGAAILVLELAR